MSLKIKFKKLREDAIIPTRAHKDDAGYDVYVPENTVIRNGRNLIDLGFAIEMPHGVEAQIRPRSGFQLKGIEGIDFDGRGYRYDADVKLGTVDAGYRGSVGVIIKNYEYIDFIVKKGTRIAQLVFNHVLDVEFEETELLIGEDRGGGFGHTGAR